MYAHGLPSPPNPQLPPHGTDTGVPPCTPLPASTLDQPTTEMQVNISTSGLPYIFMSKAEDAAVLFTFLHALYDEKCSLSLKVKTNVHG